MRRPYVHVHLGKTAACRGLTNVDHDVAVEDLIEELAFKYLLHLPSEEYENKVQLCYAFQLAHWEYLDAPETEHYSPKLSFSQFVVCMLDYAPGIGLNKENVPVWLPSAAAATICAITCRSSSALVIFRFYVLILTVGYVGMIDPTCDHVS